VSPAKTVVEPVNTEHATGFPVTVSRGGVTLLEARDADTFFARLRGLHALPPLGPMQALIIRPCSAVQTWTMRTPIDVAFLDRDARILKLDRLPPRRFSSCRGAIAAMEMANGAIDRLELREHDTLEITREPDIDQPRSDR